MNRSTWVQACFGAIVVIALVRAMVLFEPLPGWDTSPLNNVSAILGFGPTACLMLDAIACLASVYNLRLGLGETSGFRQLRLA